MPPTETIARSVLGDWEEAAERVYVLASEPKFPASAAVALSEQVPSGLWWANEACIYWQCGSRLTLWLTQRRFQAVSCARSVAQELIGNPVGWTLSKINGRLLRWAVAPHPEPGKHANHLRTPVGYGGFVAIAPGDYQWRRLVDIDAAYHQLLSRLPSPRLVWPQGGKPYWSKLSKSEQGRWRDLLALTKVHKPFRLSLHGTMLGAVSKRPYYHRGSSGTRPEKTGPFYPAALLVVRSMYELVGLESLRVQSVFSATDCVMMPPGERPEIWEGVGLSSSVRAEGATRVVNPGTYSCGPRATIYYERGETAISPRSEFERYSRMPTTLAYKEWIG